MKRHWVTGLVNNSTKQMCIMMLIYKYYNPNTTNNFQQSVTIVAINNFNIGTGPNNHDRLKFNKSSSTNSTTINHKHDL